MTGRIPLLMKAVGGGMNHAFSAADEIFKTKTWHYYTYIGIETYGYTQI